MCFPLPFVLLDYSPPKECVFEVWNRSTVSSSSLFSSCLFLFICFVLISSTQQWLLHKVSITCVNCLLLFFLTCFCYFYVWEVIWRLMVTLWLCWWVINVRVLLFYLWLRWLFEVWGKALSCSSLSLSFALFGFKSWKNGFCAR